MEFAEALRRRRMVRSFTGSPVPAAALHGILAASLRAPSAGNTQGWDAVVLEGPAQTAPFWAATTTQDWRDRSSRWPGLERAPVVVALFADPGAYVARYREADKAPSGLGSGPEAWPVPYWFVDAGQVVMALLLAAVDAGLGALFLGNFRGEAALRRSLGVPEDRVYVGAVLVGEPDRDDPPSTSSGRPRRSPEAVFHRSAW
jgi:nitroreductase